MSFWIVAPSEPIPKKTKNRIFREGKICNFLLKHNKKVTWFASSFNHHEKSKTKFIKKNINITKNYSIHYLNSLGYKKNFSISRILDHFILGLDFFITSLTAKKPETIIASYPPIETAFFATLVAKLRNIRIIIDYRDAWPETFINNRSTFLSLCLKVPLFPYFVMRNFILKYAEIITISKGFSSYLKTKFKKKNNFFYLSSELRSPKTKKKNVFFKKDKVKIKKNDFNIVFFGNYNKNKFNFDNVNFASKELNKFSKKIKIYLFGNKKFSSVGIPAKNSSPNIFYLDWVGKKEIEKVLKIAHIGLAPYRSTWDFQISVPNKISEYLSSGLPIVHSLEGETRLLLNKKKCGFYYQSSKVFVDIIKKLYSDKSIYKQYSKNSKETFKLFSDIEFEKKLDFFFN